jgi:hypothetical protein
MKTVVLGREELRKLQRSVRFRTRGGLNVVTAIKQVFSEHDIQSPQAEQEMLRSLKGVGGRRAGI